MQLEKNHLKKKYLAYVNGPILFTAPHSKRLQRGGGLYQQQCRIHLSESYTAYLACQMADRVGYGSFCVWGQTKGINKSDLDPNYLLTCMLKDSIFHQCLHFWGFRNQHQAMLHVDVHGKMNRKMNCEIDVGIRSMQVHWADDMLIELIRKHFDKNNYIFNGFFNCKPQLHGFWGGDIHTMTEQAIMLGIPSLQLEIPKVVRKQMFKNKILLKQFTNIFIDLYKQIIIPWHKNSPRKLLLVTEIKLKFAITVENKENLEVKQALYNKQTKNQLNLNLKVI